MTYRCILISPEGVDMKHYTVEADTHEEALEKAQKHFEIETDERGCSKDGWAIDVFLPE